MQDQPIINPLGQPFIELQSVDSTNNYALECIRNSTAQHGMAFFAHQQTAGKGQRGRQWDTGSHHNIALSIVLQPKPLLVSMQFQLSACIALAAFKLLSSYAGSDTHIKWPNDLYWQDRKLGGILIENIISGKAEAANAEAINSAPASAGHDSPDWKWAVAGIGININQVAFSPDLTNPVSLKQITGEDFSTISLAKELCQLIQQHFQQLINEGFKDILAEYNSALYKANQSVKLKKGNIAFNAIIEGVAPNGQLITLQDDFETRYDFGEVSLVV